MITVLLQVGLPLLEKVLAHVAKVSILIEAEGIGPFQNLTALNDSLAAVLQELKLLGRIVLRLVKHIDFVLNHREKLDREFLGSVVVGVAFIVPHITLELVLGRLTFAFFCSET